MTVQTNLPKLSRRAQRALELLMNGGEIQHRLERNNFTGRDQFETRFCATTGRSSAVKGLGFKTRVELENAGFQFKPVYWSDTLTAYKLDHAP